MLYFVFDGAGALAAYGQCSDDLPPPDDAIECTPDEYALAPNVRLEDGQVLPYTPPPPAPPPPPTTITAGAFLDRFTPAEQIAVQQAALASSQIMLGLTMGLARGVIDLTSPTLANWMASLVSVGAITQARAATLVTP